MENLEEKFKHIKGWGIDADPENEPTYPMKKWTGDDHQRLNYQPPPQQQVTVEVLHSNERPRLTAVFGTSVPPSGLSGRIRRHAFKYSEGSWGHWLPLLLADRVNVWEGLVDDFKKGIFPNVFAERGWQSEFKYNKKSASLKLAVGVAVITTAVLLLKTRASRNK